MTPRPPLVAEGRFAVKTPPTRVSAFRMANHSAYSPLYTLLQAVTGDFARGRACDDMVMATVNPAHDWARDGIDSTLFGPGIVVGERLTFFLEEIG